MTLRDSILSALVQYGLPLLVSGLIALGTLLGRWLHAHTQNSKVLGALAQGADFVGAAVAHVISGMQDDFKAALADGKVTPEEAAALKAKVLALVKAELPSALKTVADNLGPAFETWLSGKVSQAVSSQTAPVP